MGSAKKHYSEGRGFAKDDLPRHTKFSRTINALGAFEIILGLACIGIGAAIIALVVMNCQECDKILGSGIWCGAVLIITGIFGTKKSPNCSNGIMKANLVFSIIAAMFMAVLFILSFISQREYEYATVVYLHLTLCGISGLAFVFCVIHSSFCCAATCRPRPVVAVIYENPRTGEQQILYEDSKQGSFLPAAPEPTRSQTLPKTLTPPVQGRSYHRNHQSPPPAPTEPVEPPPVPEEEIKKHKRKKATFTGEMYPTIERNYLGVVNQISNKQNPESPYDNVPLGESYHVSHQHSQNVRQLRNDDHRYMRPDVIQQTDQFRQQRGRYGPTPADIGSPARGRAYTRH